MNLKFIDLELLQESLLMTGTGFTVVMVVLTILWLAIRLCGLFFQREARHKSMSPVGAVSAHISPSEEGHESISSQTLALIAAAVQTSIAGPYRIVGIEPRHSVLEKDHTQISSWSVEGRRAIFSSHRIR
ncbi:MAG: OadG family protein [Candidatus Methylacidiphilales bacterium]